MYRGRFFYLKKVAQFFLVIFGLASLAAAILYFRNSDALNVEHIEVIGDLRHLSRDDVVLLSGIKKGDKLFTIGFSEIQRNLQRFSWIDKVQVRKEFPDTIQIHITEREPAALILLDELYFVDKIGKVFKKVGPNDPLDLPVITGFESEFVRQNPYLTRLYLGRVLQALHYFVDRPFYKENPISEIHFDLVMGLTVFTNKDGLEIYYGDDDLELKQNRLEKFKLSKYYQERNFVRLDLSSSPKIIARAFD